MSIIVMKQQWMFPYVHHSRLPAYADAQQVLQYNGQSNCGAQVGDLSQQPLTNWAPITKNNWNNFV